MMLHDYPYCICSSIMMSIDSKLLMLMIGKKKDKKIIFLLMFLFHTGKLSVLEEFHSLLIYTKLRLSQDVSGYSYRRSKEI